MEKFWLICLVATSLFSCKKSDDDVAMRQEELVGTYWMESVRYYDHYQNGVLVFSGKEDFKGSSIGGGGPAVWYFKGEEDFVEYLSLGDYSGSNPENAYLLRTYYYDLAAKSLVLKGAKDVKVREFSVQQFTYSKFIVERTIGSASDYSHDKYVFQRFYPTDDWKRVAATYPNYDDLDQE